MSAESAPNEMPTCASLAMVTILEILTANRAASSRSETGRIFIPEAAINTLPSSTLVPCFVQHAGVAGGCKKRVLLQFCFVDYKRAFLCAFLDL